MPFDSPAVERGAGFFETVLLIGRRAVLWKQHLDRLDATLSHWEFPAPSRGALEAEATRLVGEAELADTEERAPAARLDRGRKRAGEGRVVAPRRLAPAMPAPDARPAGGGPRRDAPRRPQARYPVDEVDELLRRAWPASGWRSAEAGTRACSRHRTARTWRGRRRRSWRGTAAFRSGPGAARCRASRPRRSLPEPGPASPSPSRSSATARSSAALSRLPPLSRHRRKTVCTASRHAREDRRLQPAAEDRSRPRLRTVADLTPSPASSV